MSTITTATLLELAHEDTRLHRVGREWHGPCPRPVCTAARDGFRVEPERGKWACRHCRPGGGDLTGYYHDIRGMSWPDAFLAAGLEPGERPQRAENAPQEPARDVASPAWIDACRAACRGAYDALWARPASGHHRALAFLQARGIRLDTARARGLGFATGEPALLRQGPPPWPSFTAYGPGVMVPWAVGGTLWTGKVRLLRPGTGPKMLCCRWTDRTRDAACPPPSAAPHLYGADSLQGRSVAVLCEGELDAILLAQEAGDLVAVCTIGSATNLLPERGALALLPLRRILVAYDTDDAGRDGAARLLRTWPGLPLEVVRVPIEPPAGKDITDFHLAGGSLRDWIRFLLAPPPRKETP